MKGGKKCHRITRELLRGVRSLIRELPGFELRTYYPFTAWWTPNSKCTKVALVFVFLTASYAGTYRCRRYRALLLPFTRDLDRKCITRRSPIAFCNLLENHYSRKRASLLLINGGKPPLPSTECVLSSKDALKDDLLTSRSFSFVLLKRSSFLAF